MKFNLVCLYMQPHLQSWISEAAPSCPPCFFKLPFVVSCILFDNSPEPHTSVGSVMCERLLLRHGFHIALLSLSLWLTLRCAHSRADFCDTSFSEETMMWWKLSSLCGSVANAHAFIHAVKPNVLAQISVNRLLPQAPRLSSPPLFITVKVYGFYCGQITAARGCHSFLNFPSLCWGPLVFMSFIVQSQGLYPELTTLMRLMYQIQQHTHKHGHTPREKKKKSMFRC